MKSIAARYDGRPPSASGSRAPDADYFCGDGGMIVHQAQRVVGDGSVGDLAAIEQGADGTPGLVGPRVRSSARGGFLQTTRRVGAAHHGRSEARLVRSWEGVRRTRPACGINHLARSRAPGARARAGARSRTPRAAVPAPRGALGRKRPGRAACRPGGPRSARTHLARS